MLTVTVILQVTPSILPTGQPRQEQTQTAPFKAACQQTSDAWTSPNQAIDTRSGARHVNDKGELVRPWCPATRVLDQRETERENAAAEAAKRAGMASRGPPDVRQAPPRRDSFPPLEVNASRWHGCMPQAFSG